MNKRRDLNARRYLCAAVGAALAMGSWPAMAQQSCEFTSLEAPARQLVNCGETFSFEREPGTAVSITERAGNAPPQVIEVQNGAILIEVQPGSTPTQIRTPHAIAAVRGTTYVVDAGPESTSVFVLEGRVDVRKTGDASTIALGAGDGIDIAPDVSLEKQTWAPDRVSEMLARFGR